MPAPAPQATSRRRCSSVSALRSASALAMTAPACFGAPSRPREAPMPTTTTESVAVASVRSAGRRPAKFAMASVMSMLLPARELPYQQLPEARHRAGRHQNDHVAGRAGLRGGVEQVRARPAERAAPAKSRFVRIAAATPAPIPVSRTDIQNTKARGLLNVGGMWDKSAVGFCVVMDRLKGFPPILSFAAQKILAELPDQDALRIPGRRCRPRPAPNGSCTSRWRRPRGGCGSRWARPS